jgi:hypothetical protein
LKIVRRIIPSGTFYAARAELYRLRRLGIDIVWGMSAGKGLQVNVLANLHFNAVRSNECGIDDMLVSISI